MALLVGKNRGTEKGDFLKYSKPKQANISEMLAEIGRRGLCGKKATISLKTRIFVFSKREFIEFIL